MDVSIRPSEPIPVIQSQEQYPLEQRRRPVNFEAARRSNEHSARASSHGDRSSPERASNGHSSFPEGGWRAYLVLFGVWCALLPASGLLNTIGTLQAYLGTHQLGQHSQQQIGWIFSVYAFLWAFGGVQVGPLFDAYGLRVLLIPGYIGLITSVMTFSACKDYYQFMLSFGILGGASSSLIWTSSIATVGHWFLDRRGLATGLATTAGPVGGVVFPLVIQKLIPAIGFAWAVRVIGFICLGLGLVGISLMKTRLPPDRSVKRAFNLRGFKDIRFILTILAMFAIDWAVLIPPAYLTTYALAKGVNSSLSYQLLVILNTTQIFGRALPGLIADRWGRFNIMILSSLACTIAILALWLRAGSNVGAIIGFAALYGLFSGTAYSLTPVCVSQLCETEEYASRYGTAYGFISIATLAGIPASGAILGGGGGGGSGQDDGEGFRGLILTCGMAYLASTVLFTLARGVGGGWKVQKVY